MPDIAYSSNNDFLAILPNLGQFANVTQAPVDTTVGIGSTAVLHVEVEPQPGLSLQWYKGQSPVVNNDRISGATTDTLVITNILQQDQGQYRAKISGDGCTFDSSAATLTVMPACAADLAPAQGNGVVDVDDLLAVINNWGPCNGCEADLHPAGGNGSVDVDDLLAIINSWGPCW